MERGNLEMEELENMMVDLVEPESARNKKNTLMAEMEVESLSIARSEVDSKKVRMVHYLAEVDIPIELVAEVDNRIGLVAEEVVEKASTVIELLDSKEMVEYLADMINLVVVKERTRK